MAAIYMWFEQNVQIFTTTPYPIEVIDKVTLVCDIAPSSMSPLNSDDLDISANVIGVVVNTIKIFGPTPEDALDLSANVQSVVVNTIKIFGPTPEDAIDISSNVVSVVLAIRKVVVDTPDEKLQLTCNFHPSGSNMTAV